MSGLTPTMAADTIRLPKAPASRFRVKALQIPAFDARVLSVSCIHDSFGCPRGRPIVATDGAKAAVRSKPPKPDRQCIAGPDANKTSQPTI